MTVYYRLQHRYKKPEWRRYEIKLIGIFTTRVRALNAIDLVKSQPGFRRWPDGFEILELEIDKIQWELILAYIDPADAPDRSKSN